MMPGTFAGEARLHGLGAAEDRVLGDETALVGSPVTLVRTGRSSRAERRPAMSRPS